MPSTATLPRSEKPALQAHPGAKYPRITPKRRGTLSWAPKPEARLPLWQSYLLIGTISLLLWALLGSAAWQLVS